MYINKINIIRLWINTLKREYKMRRIPIISKMSTTKMLGANCYPRLKEIFWSLPDQGLVRK